MFNWCITTGLESWGQTWPVIREYIRERKKTLIHWLNKRSKK